jgi:hypothetical protein
LTEAWSPQIPGGDWSKTKNCGILAPSCLDQLALQLAWADSIHRNAVGCIQDVFDDAGQSLAKAPMSS